ncbi:MAG TPA: polysulfide reductase NrfD [Spirochaetota bacterium]|nr:polysulfide reductase NrfD [Spirochaetota bacterium]
MKFIEFLKDEFNSYSRNIQISLYVLFALVVLFGIFAIQVLFWGLGYTGMDNNFAWGVWILGDLGLVALGGGAFFTGFFLYIFRVDKLEPIINSTVLLGWMCYLFTLVLLLFDIGQPLRAWFGFAYPNWGPHLMPISMLTEVFWCLSLYFCILCVELVPVVLKQRLLDRYPVVNAIGHYMHKLMWIMAAAGTFLSFFHQGSLGGGMWGVLYGKAQWFRPHFFFLAVVAATAGGTSFMMLIPWIAGKVMKKEVVPKETFYTLAKISGFMFIFYFSFRIYDIYSMAVKYVPAADRSYLDMWGGIYGIWMLALELVLCLVPITMYLIKKFREQEKTLVTGFIAGVSAIVVSKMNVLLHGFSVPNFPWKGFTTYSPTVQEWFVFFGCIAIMTLIYMWFAKYTPLFPHLNHHEHASEGHE